MSGLEVRGPRASSRPRVLAATSLARPAAADRPALPGGRLDLADVRGQNGTIHALTVAAAGGHHLLFMGRPGRARR